MPQLPLALQSVGRTKNESSYHFLNQHEEDERIEDSPASPLGIFHRLKGARPWKVMLFVDNVPLSFEIHSGSAKSVTGSDAFDKPNKEIPPRPTVYIYMSHCRHTQEACPPRPPHSRGSVCENFA